MCLETQGKTFFAVTINLCVAQFGIHSKENKLSEIESHNYKVEPLICTRCSFFLIFSRAHPLTGILEKRPRLLVQKADTVHAVSSIKNRGTAEHLAGRGTYLEIKSHNLKMTINSE